MDILNYAYPLLIIIIAFLLYDKFKHVLFGKREDFLSRSSTSSSNNISHNIVVPPMRDSLPSFSSEKTVAGAGPNSPSQIAPRDAVAVVHGEPQSNDLTYDYNEPTNVTEGLTYPERYYRKPSVQNDVKLTQVEGLTGNSRQESSQNYQRYETDTIQNSGEFMNGIYANDTQIPSNFSSY